MENKPLFYTLIACVGVVAVMFIITISTLISVNSGTKNASPDKQIKVSEKVIKNDPVTLFTTDSTGKALEVQALLARENITATKERINITKMKFP